MFNFKKVTAVAAALALSLSAVAFVGCGGNNNTSGGGNASQTQSDSNFEGTWNFAQINVNGEDMTVAEYAAWSSQQTGQEVTADMLQAQYVFDADGSGKLVFMGTETPFTYTESGNTATVTINGVDSIFTYDAQKGVITITDPNTGFTSTFTE